VTISIVSQFAKTNCFWEICFSGLILAEPTFGIKQELPVPVGARAKF
jgi:hypothetical protein